MGFSEKSKILSYKDLQVWKLGMKISKDVLLLTESFPDRQKFVIVPQIQKAAISIPSNIAEGYSRDGTKEYIYHLSVAMGSLSELETQLLLAVEVGYCSSNVVDNILIELNILAKMLKKLNLSLRNKLKAPQILTPKS